MGCAVLFLSGCSSVSIWPFGQEERDPAYSIPADAIEYKCSGNNHFYLRQLENENAVWVILPERSFRLDKASSEAGKRFSNGADTLDIGEGQVTLTNGTKESFTECKVAEKSTK